MGTYSSTQAAINAQLIPKQVFTLEENNSQKAEPTAIVASDPTLNGLVTQFGKDIKGITTKAALNTKAKASGKAIFDHAVLRNQSVQDDRPLYWARLKMLYMLKTQMNANSAVNDNSTLTSFESRSRGFDTINFGTTSGVKKVLLTGFDPFGLDGIGGNIKQSNPSGACALYLHNRQGTYGGITAKIQCALLPVRYKDFDDGTIDTFFNKYFVGANKVDMIITMSQARNTTFYYVERYASKYRGNVINDNVGVPATGNPPTYRQATTAGSTTLNTVPPMTVLSEWLQTTLPKEKMVPGSFGSTATVYNERWSNSGTGFRDFSAHSTSPATNSTTNLPSGTARFGSGGYFLSNESFYRVCLLREKHFPTPPSTPTIPPTGATRTGHLHVQTLEQGSGDMSQSRTTALVFDVDKIIRDAISGL